MRRNCAKVLSPKGIFRSGTALAVLSGVSNFFARGGTCMNAEKPGTSSDTGSDNVERPRFAPAARRGARNADARGDSEKLRQNQQRLGVGPEHKTESMKKGHRGTFP
jgi:hypothetical protein